MAEGATHRATARWRGWLASLRERRQERDRDLYHACVGASRTRAFTWALWSLMLFLTLDDLRTLRVPAYVVGAALAIGVLAGGSVYWGAKLEREVRDLPAADARDDVRAAASRARGLLFVSVVLFVAWLMVFSLGVPPWTV